MAQASTTVTAKILADVSGFQRGLKSASSSLQSFSSAATRAGRDISVAISAPLILLGKTAFDVARQFDFAQAKLRGLKPDANFKKLEDSARQLGENTIFTAAEVGNLQVELAKIGAEGDEILQLQEPVLRLAQAMDIDLKSAADIALKTVKRFNDTFDDTATLMDKATNVSDIFAKATQKSTLTAESLRVAFSYSGVEAKSYGLTLEETVALLALLSDRGYEASRGGTALRRVLGELAKEGLNSEQALSVLFDGTGNYTELLERFGLRGAGAASVLSGLRDEFENLTETLETSQGTTETFANEIDKSLEASIKRLQSALTELALTLDDEFGQQIREIIGSLTEFVKSFSRLDSNTKKTIIQFAAFAAVLGPILLLLGGLTAAIGVLVKAGGAVILWLKTTSASLKALLIDLGLMPGAWAAQTSAAMASNAALKTTTVAANSATAAMVRLKAAMRTTVWLVVIEGILTGIEKVYRALGEVQAAEEAAKIGAAQDAALSLQIEDELKKLDDLSFAETAKRLKNGAAQLTQGFVDGIIPINVEDIGERLVSRKVAREVTDYAKLLQTSFGYSPDKAMEKAIEQQIADMRKANNVKIQQQKVDEGTITNIDKLKKQYEELTKEILKKQKAFKSGSDTDFERIDQLKKEFDDVTGKLKLFGVEGIKTFKEIISPDKKPPGWAKDLVEDFEKLNPEFAKLADSYEKSEKALKLLNAEKEQLAIKSAREEAGTGKVSEALQNQIRDVDLLISYYSAVQATQEEVVKGGGLITYFEDQNKSIGEINDEYKRSVAALELLNAQKKTLAVASTKEAANNGQITEETQKLIEEVDLLIAYYEALKEAFNKAMTKEEVKDFNRQMGELRATALGIGQLFGSAFEAAINGTESFAEAIRTTLSRAIAGLLGKLAALAIAWGVIALLATIATGGSNLQVAASSIQQAGFGNFLMQGFGMSGLQGSPVTEGGLKVQGVLSGSDISLSTKRGVTANDRIYG